MYIYRSQSRPKHSEIRSDLKFKVLVVSLIFGFILSGSLLRINGGYTFCALMDLNFDLGYL